MQNQYKMSQCRNLLGYFPYLTNNLVASFDASFNGGDMFFPTSSVWYQPVTHVVNGLVSQPSLRLVAENGNHTYTRLSTDVGYCTFVFNNYNGLRLMNNNSTPFRQSDFGAQLTIQGTLKIDSFTNYTGLFGYHNPGILAQYASSNMQFGYHPTTSGTPLNIAPSVFTTAAGAKGKYNIAVTWSINPALTQIVTTVYLNGVHIGSTSQGITISVLPNQELWVAKSYPATGRSMSGKIYNLLFYNRALTGNEVYQNYLIDKQKYDLL